MKVVAIHQPNFFPWLGYFDKIARCDTFIFLDHVQSPKTGGTWQNRVKVWRGQSSGWMTVPVVRSYTGLRSVREIDFQPGAWREGLIKSLSAAYQRAPFFDETIEWLRPLILDPEQNVALYNYGAIVEIVRRLSLPVPRWLWSSETGVTGTSNELLVALTKHAGGDSYLCGDGAGEYFDVSAFEAAGIAVRFQHFDHPRYPQHRAREFTAGLSVLDVFMNCGLAHASQLLLERALNEQA